LISLSKLPVPQETAQALFEKHMGSGERIAAYQELTEGMFNAAYRVALADGRVCVLKAAPPPEVRVLRYEREILRTEVEVLRLVKARTAMPVPGVLFHDESCELLPSACFAMDFIPGEALHRLRASLSAEEQERIDQACGGYLRQMNAIGGEAFGLFTPSARRFPTWREAFDRLMVDILLDGEEAGVELPVGYAEMLALARRHYEALEEVTRPALVHWDLWDGNIFIDAATRQVSGLIDFERALWGDPLMEVNFSAFTFNRAFLEGYRQCIRGNSNGGYGNLSYGAEEGIATREGHSFAAQGGGHSGAAVPVHEGACFTEAQKTRRLLYDLYLYLIMVIECAYRRYPTDDQEVWSRGKLGETIQGLEG
jgi:aminoglycoside phosphotransferase (APT) family kinase protein